MRVMNLTEEKIRSYGETNYFCPFCGSKGLWAELCDGDSAHKGVYGCIDCKESVYLDPWVELSDVVKTIRIKHELR